MNATEHKNRASKPQRDKKTGRITKGVAQDTNKNGTAGRPSNYSQALCQKLVKHFDVPLTYMVKKTVTYKDGSSKELEVEKVTDLPTFEGFAASLLVTHRTLREWCEKHPEFSQAYGSAKEMQERLIAANAMAGRYVGPFAQFYLKNKHDYQEKSQLEHSGQIAQPLLGGLTALPDEDEEDGDAEAAA